MRAAYECFKTWAQPEAILQVGLRWAGQAGLAAERRCCRRAGCAARIAGCYGSEVSNWTATAKGGTAWQAGGGAGRKGRRATAHSVCMHSCVRPPFPSLRLPRLPLSPGCWRRPPGARRVLRAAVSGAAWRSSLRACMHGVRQLPQRVTVAYVVRFAACLNLVWALSMRLSLPAAVLPRTLPVRPRRVPATLPAAIWDCGTRRTATPRQRRQPSQRCACVCVSGRMCRVGVCVLPAAAAQETSAAAAAQPAVPAAPALPQAVRTLYGRSSGDYMAALAAVHCQRRGWQV